MIPFPKPRGFWDYALFAMMMAGFLMLLFWVDATDRIGLSDAVFALGTGVFFAFAVILARQGEKASWIAQPTWHVHLVATLGAFILLFGALCADAYFVHHRKITPDRLLRDLILILVPTAGSIWMSHRRRSDSQRQSQ